MAAVIELEAAAALIVGSCACVVVVIERAKTMILARIADMSPAMVWSASEVRHVVDERVLASREEEDRRFEHLAMRQQAEIAAVRKELEAMRKGSAYR